MPTPRRRPSRSPWTKRYAMDASAQASTWCLKQWVVDSPGAPASSSGVDCKIMRFAFVFPGQGSQSVGMMAAFESLPEVRQTFATASRILRQDMWELVSGGPPEELNKTVNTQPVMLTAGYALLQA